MVQGWTVDPVIQVRPAKCSDPTFMPACHDCQGLYGQNIMRQNLAIFSYCGSKSSYLMSIVDVLLKCPVATRK